MVTEQGRLSSDVAQELSICVDTLRSWLKKAEIQAGQANRLNREQQKIKELEAFYNNIRPHSALGWISSNTFDKKLQNSYFA